MRVLVLGGGYAGVALIRELEDRLGDDVELLLVDETGEHVLQHELHRVVRRPSIAAAITVPLDTLVDRTEVRVGTVASVDSAAQVVDLEDGTTIEYDIGAVCLGAEPAYYDIPGVAEHGIPLKRLEHADRIRERFLELLERTSESDSPASVVVGGAGLSGIQLSGELAALAREQEGAVGADGTVRIRLLEQADTVAPGFDRPFQDAIRNALEARGVDIETGATIERATAETVHLDDGQAIDVDQFVWTGGIDGSAALGGERPLVNATLELGDRTFVLGDAARILDADGSPVPASAQSAIRAASVVAENVERLLEGRDGPFEPRMERFTFQPRGWIVSVGDGAVAQVGPKVVTGPAAVALKASVGIGYLSSVGAVREAVDLVNDELELAVDGRSPGD